MNRRPTGFPALGENVTIPYGWTLVIDISPPPLFSLVIQGNVSFSNSSDITLAATYLLIMAQGVLSAGSQDVPHPMKAMVLLNGTRQTPDWALTNTLDLGSKFIAVVQVGSACRAPGEAAMWVGNRGWGGGAVMRVGDRGWGEGAVMQVGDRGWGGGAVMRVGDRGWGGGAVL